MEIDTTDHRILNALRTNADVSNTALAQAIGLSASACLRRVARLKESGVIEGIVARVDPAVLGRGLSAIVTVELERDGPTHRKGILGRIQKEPAVSQCYMVTGTVSLVVHIHMADMDEYMGLADTLFHADKNVKAFTTHIVMSTEKDVGL